MGSEDLLAFATNLAIYSPPLVNEANKLICYGEQVPETTCQPFDIVSGVFTKDSTGFHLSLGQCYELLKAEWPYVQSKYTPLFGSFSLPGSTATELPKFKSVLWMWILQYGPYFAASQPWTELLAVFNRAVDWGKLLAWAGTTPGISYDGTRHYFPTYVTVPAAVLTVLNSHSTVCDAISCDFQAECALVKPGSTCVAPS
jgi:hypothetical protein